MSVTIFRLKQLMFLKFDSEVEFAEHLGWSFQRLNEILSGEKEPDIDEVFAIAEGLEVDFEMVSRLFIRFWVPKKARKHSEPIMLELDTSIPSEDCILDE